MVKPKKVGVKKSEGGDDGERKNRNFPKHSLADALVVGQKIQDEMAGQPMKRLLLAGALGLSPSSINYRDLISSSNKYGLTEGNEKSDQIKLTPIGADATQSADQTARLKALRSAALVPPMFAKFYRDYANKKMPSAEMLPKILGSQYFVPQDIVQQCSSYIGLNGRHVEIIREIGGSCHVLLDDKMLNASSDPDAGQFTTPPPSLEAIVTTPATNPTIPPNPASTAKPTGPRPIFIGHGKNRVPLQQLERLLTTFQIPHKVVMGEPNLGRPIPQKVKDIIEECGSAILIFTKDEKFFDEKGAEIWRANENVVHELGATSYVYGDRIVIFKEKGLYFPTNFQSIGYIEFESGDLAARTADLLKELIGFGLVKVTPTQ